MPPTITFPAPGVARRQYFAAGAYGLTLLAAVGLFFLLDS